MNGRFMPPMRRIRRPHLRVLARPLEATLMAHWDRRFIHRLFNLLQECGMPERTPTSDLLDELYDMIEEHLRVTRGD